MGSGPKDANRPNPESETPLMPADHTPAGHQPARIVEPARAILVAAGRGERLGFGLPKARIPLAGTPLFLHALGTLLEHPRVRDVLLVVPEDPAELDAMMLLLGESFGPVASRSVRLVPGGAERQDSVLAALVALEEDHVQPGALVLVHDAARPLLRPDLVTRCLDAMEMRFPFGGQGDLPGLAGNEETGRLPVGAVPGLPVRETLKLVYGDRVINTQPREGLYAVQTPQVFRFGPLLQAHRRAHRYGLRATDDAALLEWQGLPVRLVPGDPENLKVTFPGDLELAEGLLETRPRARARSRGGNGSRS
jgi:2-C-methyl-D-erythritol 4-phosphate cytidylyltransferase